ncbi:hypothetical protein L204_101252 [Cryptococcus depauperatus]
MKFGKTIQAQQVPGWGEYYLNYKALKKIINSYAAGRPASDASLLSLGLRSARPHAPVAVLSNSHGRLSSNLPIQSCPPSPLGAGDATFMNIKDLEPLPPETTPPNNTGNGIMSMRLAITSDRDGSFKAHRDVFFFTLQRELEKINAFYLVKERDLRLRLLTLLSNRKRLVQSSTSENNTVMRRDAEWTSLEEAWRLFEHDLGKLQGFIEINATGFRKILKKWDKRSKSNTKELYLERQVEVQPCFNREFIAKLSDIVAANLLDIVNGSDHLSTSFLEDNLFSDISGDGIATLSNTHQSNFDADSGRALAQDALADLEINMVKALSSGHEAIVDWMKIARDRQRRINDKGLMRVLWRTALQAPTDELSFVLQSVNLDYNYIDNINGRCPLHLACIAGSYEIVKLCLDNNRGLLEVPDAYDRRPLHYASMNGHAHIVPFLLANNADPTATDMDGYTPLMHAVQQGHVKVVRIFVDEKIAIEPTAISSDLIPLSLACQFGQIDVVRLLLQSGARIIPNSEGLYPQHLAAKAGHEAICKLLIESGGPEGGGKDRQDKYNLWTPLHHAAIGGGPHHLACVKVLVAAGCDVNASDEYGKSPGWYAAWFGHVECLNFLLAHGAKLSGKLNTLQGMEHLGLAADPQMESLSPGSDLDLNQPQDDFEIIPSLSLPPPIIPLRVYGHEFLASRCLIQISLGHRITKYNSGKHPPIKLYSRSGHDSLHLWSSLKLVMTSKTDITAVPHSVILPLSDEREVFSFHTQDLDSFTLELSLYPTFGSKVIGRAVVLPITFSNIQYQDQLVVPLLDHNLKTIGEVAFEVSCIRPFEEAQLEIGGRVETYWKSQIAPSTSAQDHARLQPHRPLNVLSNTPTARPPAVAPASTVNISNKPALVTASSLSGEYIHVVVQVTKDGVPVVYPHFRLPVQDFDLGVSNVTCSQFFSLAESHNLLLRPPDSPIYPSEWYRLIAMSFTTLKNLLAILPPEIGINLRLQYTRNSDAELDHVGRSVEVNQWVDNVLHAVYESGNNAHGISRKIIFSSFDPIVCTALNWKQPNYAVFFASFCGLSRHKPSDFSSLTPHLVSAPPEEESDVRCLSVREAVYFAKSMNLLGVILEASTLVAVPSLVTSVKDAGLLLATFDNVWDVTDIGKSQT